MALCTSYSFFLRNENSTLYKYRVRGSFFSTTQLQYTPPFHDGTGLFCSRVKDRVRVDQITKLANENRSRSQGRSLGYKGFWVWWSSSSSPRAFLINAAKIHHQYVFASPWNSRASDLHHKKNFSFSNGTLETQIFRDQNLLS